MGKSIVVKVWVVVAQEYEECYIDSVWATEAGAKKRTEEQQAVTEANFKRYRGPTFDYSYGSHEVQSG